MFDRELTTTEITDLYASGAGKTYADYFASSPVVKTRNTVALADIQTINTVS